MQRGIAVALLLVSLVIGGQVGAQKPAADAETVTSGFLRALDQDDLAMTFQNYAGPMLRANMDANTFSQQVGIIRIQTGGPAKSRQLVGSQLLNQVPGTGVKGEFHYSRYRTQFPTAQVFQDVYLEKAEGAWKVAGFWFTPVPPQ